MTHFSIDSNYTNYKYDISVYVPSIEVPTEGFPIIYVLDGLSYFPLAKQIIHLQSRNSAKTKIENAIVVGICHREETMHSRRFYDFTAPAEKVHFPAHTKGKLNHIKEVGGAENFSSFITKELKPIIESQFKINKSKQSIYGHSLSGYYVLWSYLTKPNEFQTSIAVSPSIWWNNRELFCYLQNCDVNKLGSLYMIVGEREGFMVEDAVRFYKELPTSIYQQLFIAMDENHASVVPTTMSRAFRFCFEVNNG
ncbi:alpha/beta hydrolase [Ureibacillus sp. FSL E2-3493]|uniref:alpha/beta hydrolase n=1 Tax=Ureibacillus sp. FSL E2-3493 TaxID=2921367 RepID=UPI003119E6BD